MNNLIRLLETNEIDEFSQQILALPTQNGDNFYHELIKIDVSDVDLIIKCIFILSDMNININHQNIDLQTCLHLAIKRKLSLKIVNSLLQNGADLTLIDRFGKCSYNYVKYLNDSIYEKEILSLMKAYYPTYSIALCNNDLASCRKLVNSWSKFNGAHLKLAKESENEAIYDLFCKLSLQFDVNFAVLACNVNKLRKIELKRVNLNFKNMHDRFASLKFYIVIQNNVDLIELFAENRQFWTIFNDYMLDKDSYDIPVLFELLKNQKLTKIIKYLFEKSPLSIDLSYLRYRGLSILRYMVDLELDLDIFEFLIKLKYYSNELFTLRDPSFKTIFEYCQSNGLYEYLNIIQKIILDDIINNTKFRVQLAYNGFDFHQSFIDKIRSESTLTEFFMHLDAYQDAIKYTFHQAERNSPFLDLEVTNFDYFISNLSDAKIASNSQYLIHRLVFNRDHVLLKALLEKRESIVKLDFLRDHHQRTPLHYAYGMKDNQKCVHILLEFGFSENVFDKDGKSPLDFAERIDSYEISEVIRINKEMCFQEQEPNPWSYRVWTELQKAKDSTRQLIPFFNPNALNYHHHHNHRYHHTEFDVDYLHNTNKQYFCNLL